MSDKLKSRKLWVFIALVALVVGNFIFGLGMPTADVLYLVILGASYILGQGFVDAKQLPVKDFPVDDVTRSVSSIIQAELSKIDFGKNIPMEKIIEGLTPIMKQILKDFTFSAATPTITDPLAPIAADPDPQ